MMLERGLTTHEVRERVDYSCGQREGGLLMRLERGFTTHEVRERVDYSCG